MSPFSPNQVHDNVDVGCTVEMHGSIRQLLCPVCGLVIAMNDFLCQQLRRRTTIPCTACSCPALRSRIMMYGDAEGEISNGRAYTSAHTHTRPRTQTCVREPSPSTPFQMLAFRPVWPTQDEAMFMSPEPARHRERSYIPLSGVSLIARTS